MPVWQDHSRYLKVSNLKSDDQLQLSAYFSFDFSFQLQISGPASAIRFRVQISDVIFHVRRRRWRSPIVDRQKEVSRRLNHGGLEESGHAVAPDQENGGEGFSGGEVGAMPLPTAKVVKRPPGSAPSRSTTLDGQTPYRSSMCV